MFCPECGHEMPGRSTYCPSCQNKIEYPSDKRASRITLRDVFNVLVLTVLLFIILLFNAWTGANTILPNDLHYSGDGRCDVCGFFSDTELEVDGSIEHEFCYTDAVVYDMSHPASILTYSNGNGLVHLFSKWLLLIIALLTVARAYWSFTGFSRGPVRVSHQVYMRGTSSMSVGFGIWLLAGSFLALYFYDMLMDFDPLSLGPGAFEVLRSLSLFSGFIWCLIGADGLMRPFEYDKLTWSKEVFPWSKGIDPVLVNIRTSAHFFAFGAILCMVSSTVLGRDRLLQSILFTVVGVFLLVFAYWPVRDSATHPTTPL